MVEVARLESVYRFIAYRGFESPSLRQEQNKMATPAGGHFFCSGRRDGDSKGIAYSRGTLRIAHLPPLGGGVARRGRAFHP